MRETSRFGGSPMPNHTFTHFMPSESKISNTCEEHIEECKVRAGDWLVQNFELHKDFS